MTRTPVAPRCRMSAIAAVFLGVLLWVAASATRAEEGGARIASEAYQRVNESLVRHHVLPRYRRFAQAAAHLHEAVLPLCASPASSALERAREAFHAAMDAFMAMQHLQFGPLEQKLRAHRLYFWPQARGKVGEAIAELHAEGDHGVLSPERFSGASVAVQGLPAAEHLLFSRSEAMMPGDVAGRAECRVLEAVSRNLERIAGEAEHEWTVVGVAGTSVPYAALMLEPGPDNADFPAPKEATLLLFSALHNQLELIADVKVTLVIGDSPATVRPALAESRASGRSTRNIVINLEALQALYVGESGPGLGDLVADFEEDAQLDPLMRKAFRLTLDTARSIEVSLEAAAADPESRPWAEKLSLQVRALREIVRTRVATALDLAVGFNALDGD